jgi:hypothetical protein
MPVPSSPHDTQAALAVLAFIGSWACVSYWRTVLRLLIIALIALAVFGTVVAIEVVRSLMEPHQ